MAIERQRVMDPAPRSGRISAATFVAVALTTGAVLGGSATTSPLAKGKPAASAPARPGATEKTSPALVAEGRRIFRFDTFGDEKLWTDTLRLNEVVEKSVDPTTALKVGLKVDADVLPPGILEKVDLKSPATTVALLKMNAIVGIQATVDANNHITRLGVTCALCHSTVDNSVMPGIGHRKDGWPNRDLNVGAIIALSPVLPADKKAVYESWGPGKYDPRFNLDGKNTPLVHPTGVWPGRCQERDVHGGGTDLLLECLRRRHPDGRARQLLRPAAGDRGHALARHGHRKLPALRAYQHSLPAPPPPAGSFDAAAAARGRAVFDQTCAVCHVGGSGTDNNTGKLHAAGGHRRRRSVRRAHGQQGVPHDAPARHSGSTRRTSTTAARRRSPTWWRTTTGFARSA